jgi:hypothetical protein
VNAGKVVAKSYVLSNYFGVLPKIISQNIRLQNILFFDVKKKGLTSY